MVGKITLAYKHLTVKLIDYLNSHSIVLGGFEVEQRQRL
jgi:hypothetical protein